MKPKLVGLWGHPDFMKLWFGQTISEFGSRISRDGLPLVAVITLAASPAQMGLLTAVASLPILLFGLHIGVMVDRWRRRPVLIAVNILRPLILLLIPLAVLMDSLSIGIVIGVAAAVSFFSVVFEVAYRAYLPALIPPQDLVEGNSKLATTDSLAEVGGPAITGLLVQWLTAPMAILVDVGSYVVAAVSLLTIRQVEVEAAEPLEERNSWREIGDGWRFLWKHPLLKPMLLYIGMTNFFGSFIGTLYALFAIQTLRLSPSQLGLVIACGGIGAVLGATVAGWLPRWMNLGHILVVSLGISSMATMIIPLAGGSPTSAMLFLMVAQIIGDGGMTVFFIHEVSLRQVLTPEGLLGRVNASGGFLVQGIAPLGALMAGLLATATSPRAVLWIAAVGILAAGIWVMRSPVAGLVAYPVREVD